MTAMGLPLLFDWQNHIGAALMRRYLFSAGARMDFLRPAGESALASPDSVTWRIFKNPVALFAGGVAAVILELAEPRVRTGVWEHTTFRTDPVARMKRTGMAAMVTAYAARSVAERMIAGVSRMHAKIGGHSPTGAAYAASDPELLDWVQITASFGFLEAYVAYVSPLTSAERDRSYAEAAPAARLYGVTDPASSQAEVKARFAAMVPKLERSDIVLDFLTIVARAPILPTPFKPLQHVMIRAGVDLVPADIRTLLGLGERWRLRPWERRVVRLAGAASDRLAIPGSPPVEACRRLGFAPDHLYRSRKTSAQPI
jgi:uncharacterized protein (DUF2236 family)